MKVKDLFENWGLTNIKLNVGFMEAEFEAKPDDQEAAWEMYVELITRTLTQELRDEDGDEKLLWIACIACFPSLEKS